MAKNDKPDIDSSKITELEKNVQTSIDKLYSTVHVNSPELNHTIDYMRARMHKSIDSIINNNISNTGISNISSLYGRTKNYGIGSDKKITDSIIKTFEDDTVMNNVMGLYSQNVFLKELDKEVDTCCKYMPKLLEALDTRKEAVLSADHFTKDSINIKSASADLSEISSENNIKSMREKYNISEILERVFDETDRLGECFVYCVPYKKALERILSKNPNGLATSGEDIVTESFNYTYNESKGIVDIKDNPSSSFIKENGGLVIELNQSGVIESAIGERTTSENVLSSIPDSINEEYTSSMKKLADTASSETLKKTLYRLDNTSQDGLISATPRKTSDNINVPGCVLKILDHTMVKPLYIEDTCLGYYYIEADHDLSMEQLTFSSTLGGLKPGSTARRISENRDDTDKEVLRKISMQISRHIDSKFINANQDLTKEIYLILKYNMQVNNEGRIGKIRITFIPPEDIIHSYFKKDPKSNRGISALQKALFPAKLYSCLYISNVIAILTRGNDKRVYYVRQNVDTNISAVLLNTINQIKRSNFGLRQIENLNNIMNITGRFNDYVIPESASGDAPVRFEIMEGQKVEVQSELMQALEEMAVNSTDVPLEVIQARQQLDFATHYTMSNTRFLRKVYNLQSKATKIFNKILTRVYDAEFETCDSVEVELPPPMYLSLLGMSQIFDNANTQVESILPLYVDVDNEDPELVSRVKGRLKKFYMKSFLPDEAIQRIIDTTRMELKRDKKDNDQDTGM